MFWKWLENDVNKRKTKLTKNCQEGNGDFGWGHEIKTLLGLAENETSPRGLENATSLSSLFRTFPKGAFASLYFYFQYSLIFGICITKGLFLQFTTSVESGPPISRTDPDVSMPILKASPSGEISSTLRYLYTSNNLVTPRSELWGKTCLDSADCFQITPAIE